MPAKNQKAYHTQYRSSVDEDATAKRALEVKPSGRRHASMCKTYIFFIPDTTFSCSKL